MSIELTTQTMQASALGAENPLPKLRDPAPARALKDGGLTAEERSGFAQNTGWRVLPYRMQDEYGAQPKACDMPVIVLENEHLAARFLPSLGGRLISLYDKALARECLFHNPVIKLSDLALRNAWFSGGIEWNYGHFGHTFFTCAPMFFSRVTDRDGDEFLRMYEFERCHSTVFQADFHLKPGAKYLTVHFSLANPNDEAVPLFLWTNTAISTADNPRIFSGTNQVILQRQSARGADDAFLHARLPDPYSDGVDHSYPNRLDHCEEYFFQNPPAIQYAYEAALYDDGRLLVDRSSANYPYRKLFCWGEHPGGRRWQEHLSVEGGGKYAEVQAGYARTQVHGASLPPHEVIHITQLFASGLADPSEIPADYDAAGRAVCRYVDALLPVNLVEREHARCLGVWDAPATELIHEGSGWGALERMREKHYLPSHLAFPESTMGPEQSPWAALLRGQSFPGGASFMTAKPWKAVLEQALAADPMNVDLCTHVGIMLAESLNRKEAKARLAESLSIMVTPLAHRTMAVLLNQEGQIDTALTHMRSAIGLLKTPDRAYAEEYLLMLTDAGRFEDAYAYHQSLPEHLKAGERMCLTAALSAYELNDDAFLDAQYARTFSVIKEGEARFIDTWFKREARREAERRGVPMDDRLVNHIRRTMSPPKNIDFRMHREELL